MAESADRRTDILRRAARVLLEHGYERSSMDEIAREAGVSKPGLYYHFKSKTELLFAIMTMAMDELERETLAAMVKTERAVDKLRAILLTHASMITRDRDRAFTYLVTTELDSLDAENRRVVAQRLRSYRALIQATLEQLAREGALRPGIDPAVAAHTLVGMVAWLSFWFSSGGCLAGPAVAAMVTEMALAAVIPDAAR